MRFYQYLSFTIKFPSKWTHRVNRNGIPNKNTLSHLNPVPARTYGSFFTSYSVLDSICSYHGIFWTNQTGWVHRWRILRSTVSWKVNEIMTMLQMRKLVGEFGLQNCQTNWPSRLILPKSLSPSFLKNLTDPRMYQNSFSNVAKFKSDLRSFLLMQVRPGRSFSWKHLKWPTWAGINLDSVALERD